MGKTDGKGSSKDSNYKKNVFSVWKVDEMLNKKGDIWISAVLYFGLGIIVLTIILAAGQPVINRIKDKNIVIQTKNVLFKLDDNMNEVITGGPGTQRVVDVTVTKGEFYVKKDKLSDEFSVGTSYLTDDNNFIWNYETKEILSEPCDLDKPDCGDVAIPESSINILTRKLSQAKTYKIYLWSEYGGGDRPIYIYYDGTNPLSGTTKMTLRNEGVHCKNWAPNVDDSTSCGDNSAKRTTVSISA